MTTPLSEPLSYERVMTARLAGCLAYFLMVPMLCVLGVITGAAVGYGVAFLVGGGKEALIVIFSSAGFLGAAFVGIRDYRRRAGNRILIHFDRLEVVTGTKPEIYRFEEIAWIAGPSLESLSRGHGLPLVQSVVLTLKRKDGRKLHLRNEEWPLKELSQGLLDRAIPAMARLLSERVDRGEILDFRPGLLESVRYLIAGAVCLGLGGVVFFLWGKKMWIEKKFQFFGLPLLLTLAGISTLIKVARAKGRLFADRSGIRARRADRGIPWELIQDIQTLPDGANIQADDGSTLFVGMMVRNYDACLEMVRRRLTVNG